MNHQYLNHVKDVPCPGCRAEGLDCLYESLAICRVCGGMEGALLPECPGHQLSYDEHQTNYKHYCNNTGPFANQRHHS